MAMRRDSDTGPADEPAASADAVWAQLQDADCSSIRCAAAGACAHNANASGNATAITARRHVPSAVTEIADPAFSRRVLASRLHFQEVANHLVSALGEHALGMELHALNGKMRDGAGP